MKCKNAYEWLNGKDMDVRTACSNMHHTHTHTHIIIVKNKQSKKQISSSEHIS
jgi:hypothetical protein